MRTKVMIESCYQQYGQRKSKCIVVEHEIPINDVLVVLSCHTKHLVRLPKHPKRKIKGRQTYTLEQAIKFVRELKFTHNVYLRIKCLPTELPIGSFYEKPFDLEPSIKYNTTFIKNINTKIFTDVKQGIKEIFNKDVHLARSGCLYIFGTYNIVWKADRWNIVLLTKAPDDKYIMRITEEDSNNNTQHRAAWQL